MNTSFHNVNYIYHPSLLSKDLHVYLVIPNWSKEEVLVQTAGGTKSQGAPGFLQKKLCLSYIFSFFKLKRFKKWVIQQDKTLITYHPNQFFGWVWARLLFRSRLLVSQFDFIFIDFPQHSHQFFFKTHFSAICEKKIIFLWSTSLSQQITTSLICFFVIIYSMCNFYN